MKALTVIQPWASLIVGSPTEPPQKTIENRSWTPPESMLGQRFAIHAGKKLNLDEFHYVFRSKVCGEVVAPFATPALFPLGSVVGVATLDKVFSGRWTAEDIARHADIMSDSTGRLLGPQQLRWFFGPVGYLLRDVRALATPVPCKGALGFWQLSADVETAVVEQIGAA